MEVLAPPTVEWGVAAAPRPGELGSGDLHVVKPFPGGVLVAAMDGLGHGQEAASAARIAGAILEEHASESPAALARRCHDALLATRGVVMSLGSVDLPRALLTWLGVGNVQGVLLRRGALGASDESLLLRAGVLGAGLPRLDAAVLPLSRGNTLVFATDGVASDFDRELARKLPPRRAAEAILALHYKSTDDALVLVVRFVGAAR